jgi:hypothetical protein
MAHEVWIGSVAVTALEGCLVLPPGDRAWVDVLVGAAAGPDCEVQVRQAVIQYHLQIDGFGPIGRVRDRPIPLERTAQRLERELSKRTGVRLMTFRPIIA